MVKNPPANAVQSLGREDPWRRKWQPTPVFLLGHPIDRGAWWATVHVAAKESDMTLTKQGQARHRLSTHYFRKQLMIVKPNLDFYSLL